MTTIEKIIKEFDEKFPLIGYAVKQFLLSALKTIATEAVDSTKIEEKDNDNEHQGTNLQNHCESCIKNSGYNAAGEESQQRGAKWLKENFSS